MASRKQDQNKEQNEIASLKSRLEETEETLRAIRQYMVDAFVVADSDIEQVMTLSNADFPYRTMVESMNEGAITLIPDGTIFYCNPRFGEMVEAPSEKLIGTQFQDLIERSDQAAFETLLREAGQQGQRGEFCLQTSTGKCIPVQLSIQKHTQAGADGISIIATDLSERVKAEEALRHRENLNRLIATNSPDVIFAQDRDLRYSWIINPAGSLSSDQVLGKTDWDLSPPEEAQRITQIKEAILKTGVSHKEEFVLRPNGDARWYDAIYQPLYDEKQQIIGVVCYARDITERVQANQKIRSLASKLTLVEQEERHRISQILHDDLQQRLFAAKAQLPLLFELIEKDHIPPEVFSELDRIQELLTNTIAMTRNLSIDLNPVVLQGEGLADAVNWLAFRMKEQYGLHINVEARDSFINLDHHIRMLLFQSIRELLFNVVKHAGVPEASVILEKVDGQGCITVADNGKGFEAEAVMKNVKIAHGLLIVQDRLNLLGCEMQVISQPGSGTRVVIRLPEEMVGT